MKRILIALCTLTALAAPASAQDVSNTSVEVCTSANMSGWSYSPRTGYRTSSGNQRLTCTMVLGSNRAEYFGVGVHSERTGTRELEFRVCARAANLYTGGDPSVFYCTAWAPTSDTGGFMFRADLEAACPTPGPNPCPGSEFSIPDSALVNPGPNDPPEPPNPTQGDYLVLQVRSTQSGTGTVRFLGFDEWVN